MPLPSRGGGGRVDPRQQQAPQLAQLVLGPFHPHHLQVQLGAVEPADHHDQVPQAQQLADLHPRCGSAVAVSAATGGRPRSSAASASARKAGRKLRPQCGRACASSTANSVGDRPRSVRTSSASSSCSGVTYAIRASPPVTRAISRRRPAAPPLPSIRAAGDAELAQRVHLVAHERQERRHHHHGAARELRRELEDQALAGPGRQHQQHVAPVEHRLDRLALPRAEVVVPEARECIVEEAHYPGDGTAGDYGVKSTFTAPSCFFWNISYASGASSSGSGGWRSRRRRAGRRRSAAAGCRPPSASRSPGPSAAGPACRTAQHRQRVGRAAVHARERDRAAAAHQVDRQVERVEPVDAGRLASASRATASGSSAVIRCASLPTGEPCASIPTASITASGPRPPVRPRTTSPRSSPCSLEVEHLDAARAGALEPLGHEVDADHRLDAAVRRDPGGHVADRAEAEHDDACRPSGTSAYSTRLPRRRQHVGEEHEAVVRRPVRHLDRHRVAERHPQVLGLPARAPARTAWCSRTAPRRCRARAPGSSRTATAGPGRTCSRCRTRC